MQINYYHLVAGSFFVFFFICSCNEKRKENNPISDELNISDIIKKRKEYMDYDYFSHSYKFLDSDYNINIDSIEYREAVRIFFPEIANANQKADSLSVVLMLEFQNKDKVRIAKNRLLMSWNRLGYYLFMTEDEAKSFFQPLGYKMPYVVYFDIVNNINAEEFENLLQEIKLKLKQIRPEKNFNELSNNNLLREALFLNPKRTKEMSCSSHDHSRVSCKEHE